MNNNTISYLLAMAGARCLALSLFLLLGAVYTTDAQPVVSARNLSLGGGGTAYLSGIEANFYNPANLAIYDRRGKFHLNIGNIGAYFEPVLSEKSPRSQYEKFTGVFAPLDSTEQRIDSRLRMRLINDNYTKGDLTSEHFARADFVWGGLQWRKEDRSISLALRTRMGSRIEVGRGWYSPETILAGENNIRDLTLIKQLRVFHEISLGYSQELKFLNGLIPRINRFYIGFAPKFIIGGAYQNAIYKGRYIREQNQPTVLFKEQMSYLSSGSISRMTEQYIEGAAIQSGQGALGNSFNVQPTGYGVGMDFGLTYVMPLGSDVSPIKKGENRTPMEKSLRIAFSMTDIGIIRYSKSPLSVEKNPTITQLDPEPLAETKFIGAPGQFADFLNRTKVISDPLRNNSTRKNHAFNVMLPTSINAGAVLDINRARIMADLTLGLKNTALTNTKLTARLGFEARPVTFMPVRLGTTLAAGKPVSMSAGIGIETANWDLSLAGQVLFKSNTLTTDVVGGGFSLLRLHF